MPCHTPGSAAGSDGPRGGAEHGAALAFPNPGPTAGHLLLLAAPPFGRKSTLLREAQLQRLLMVEP